MTEARKDRRAPASIKVKYKSANMTEFVELVGGDVSRGGIFVKTKKPLEPGALLKFEFQLQGGEPMIYGVGRVAWRRSEEGARPTLPAGMGIKFIKLNGLSKSVIDRIEAKHGPGSRFEQTEGAEIATSISSAPPNGTSQVPGDLSDFAPSMAPSATLITPLRPEAARAAAESEALTSPRVPSGQPGSNESGRAVRSSPPLREARVSGPKPPATLAATFRPPPPAAAGSVPPPHAAPSSHPPHAAAATARPTSTGAFGAVAVSSRAAGGTVGHSGLPAALESSPAAAVSGSGSSSGTLSAAVPLGALSAGSGNRRAVSTRSAARDASEFLASAFSVGGAGREVRSEAHAQVERARHDPRSVDLANELFGDLNAPAAKPDADATLDADPLLSELSSRATAANSPFPTAAGTPRPSPNPERVSGAGGSGSPRLRSSPKPVASDQLSLKLGGASNVTTERPAAKGGKLIWISAIAVLGLGIGAGAFYLQRAAEHDVVEAPPPGAAAAPAAPPTAAAPVEAPKPVEAVVSVDVPVSSEPAGAELSVDGAPAGATPTTLKLTQGKTVQLSLHKPGYVTKLESVSVTQSMPARSVTLEALPYELVVSEPQGATVKVLDKSVEAPAPLNLGVLFGGPTGTGAQAAQELTVTIEKAGFQRATRKLTRADFLEQPTAMRAELSVPLQAAGPAAKAAPPAKAAKQAVLAKAAPTIAAAPSEPQAPPEPEATPAAEAKAEPQEKPAAPAEAPSAPAPEAQAPAAAPEPPPAAPAKPPESDIPEAP